MRTQNNEIGFEDGDFMVIFFIGMFCGAFVTVGLIAGLWWLA